MTIATATRNTALDADACWQVVEERRASARGLFIIAVRTTGVYCRPGCPARTPKRENVEFFAAPDDAEAAGYRACKRCHPRHAAADPQQELIQRVCDRLAVDDGPAPSLAALAAEFHVSPFHLQRTFKRVTGVTPAQYAAAHRVGRLKRELRRELRAENGVAGAVYRAGFGSGSRVYEQSGLALGMTPAAYGRGGRGMRIGYTIAACPLGRVLVAATERGIAFVSLGDDGAALEEALRREYPAAEIARDDRNTKDAAAAVLRAMRDGDADAALPLDVRATAFQARVWQALREIPSGETRSYAEVARSFGRPAAARAVARACATNPVPIVVPCHRVVRGDGALAGYRWGIERKRALLAGEQRAVKGKQGR